MFLLLLTLRWVGAFVIAFTVFFALVMLGTKVQSPDFAVSAYGFEISTLLEIVPAFAVGALVVPREQRKAAVLALWIFAILYYAWPLVTGHRGIYNYLLLGAAGVGGSIVYCLARTRLFGGRISELRNLEQLFD